MKLICSQEKFKQAVYNCERIVSKKNTLPILNNILLEANKSTLKLSATNLEIGVFMKTPAKIEKEGSITIPAKLLSNFSNNLSNEDNIEMEVVDSKLKIKSGLSKTIINGLSANDFPIIPDKKNDYILEFSALDLKKNLESVIPATAINDARQELNGVNLTLNSDSFIFAATDSFRLAEFKTKIKEFNINKDIYSIFIEKNKNIIIPINTIIELNRIIATNIDQKIKITIEDGQIFFENNNTKLVSRLINGKYPAYEHIIPKDWKTRIIGKKQILQNAVKMANIFSMGGNSEINLKIDTEKKKVSVSSYGSETGENLTEVKFEVSGLPQEVVFNAKYFLDGINVFSGDKIAVLLNTPTTPVAIRGFDEKNQKISEDLTYIIMPIKN